MLILAKIADHQDIQVYKKAVVAGFTNKYGPTIAINQHGRPITDSSCPTWEITENQLP
jgi:hypothetical protein